MQLLNRFIFISSVIAFLSFSSAEAQWRFGALGGVHILEATSGSVSVEYNEVIGLYVDHLFQQGMYVFASPMLLWKNGFSVLEVPVGFKYRLGMGQVGSYLAGGVATAFIFKPSYSEIVVINGITKAVDRKHRGVDFLPHIGIGVEIGYPGEAGFSMELRYSRGALSTSDNSSIEDVHTGDVMFTMSMMLL